MNHVWTKLKARSPAIILLAASLLFWGFYDRYKVVGEELLDAPSISDAWRVRGDCVQTNDQFILTVPEGGERAGLNFRLEGAVEHHLIRVRGRMRGEGVAEGDRPWRCARLTLIQYDEHNKWIPGHHRLVSERGTFDWMHAENVFEIHPQAVHADLVIENLGDAGRAVFERFTAEPVRVRASFVWWRIVFTVAWVTLAAIYYKRCRLDHRKLRMLILLNTFAILAGTLMPSQWIATPADGLRDWIVARMRAQQQAPAQNAPSTETPGAKSDAEKQRTIEAENEKRIDRFTEAVGGAHKAGHFILFAALCFLVYCSAALEGQGPAYYLKVGGDLLLFAAISESLQYLTFDRTPGFSDFMMDVYGMALAFAVFLVLRRFLGYRQRRTVV